MAVRIDVLDAEITHHVIGAFFDVDNALGSGFIEHVYAQALEWELVSRGRRVGREVAYPSATRAT